MEGSVRREVNVSWLEQYGGQNRGQSGNSREDIEHGLEAVGQRLPRERAESMIVPEVGGGGRVVERGLQKAL